MQHAPARGITRTDSPHKRGHYGEQVKVFEFSEAEIRNYILRAAKIDGGKLDVEKFLRDLTQSICIMQKDGANYVFSHRSFQEYFAAYCIDRVLQEQAGGILESFSKRHTDATIPMLFDMNRDLVETHIVLPFLNRLSKEVGSPDAAEFFRKFSETFKATINLEFYEGGLVDWSVNGGDFSDKAMLMRKLYFDALNIDTGGYHRLDDDVLKAEFPNWNRRERRHLKPEKFAAEKIIQVAIRARANSAGDLVFFVDRSLVAGKKPSALGDLAWIDKLGYAEYCREHARRFERIRLSVNRRRGTKNKSIEQLLKRKGERSA